MATTTEDLIRDEVITALEDALSNKKNFTPKFIAEIVADYTEEQHDEFQRILFSLCYKKKKLNEMIGG